MSYKNLDQKNITTKPFVTHKSFSWTNNDSGSGIYAIKAVSSSLHNYDSGSDLSVSFTSGSGTTDAITTNYYELPTWHLINNLFYKNSEKPYQSFGGNQPEINKRELHTSASVFSIPRQVYGEEIKPGTVEIEDTSRGQTFDIRDDGDGNLYDFAHSSSFAAYKSSSFDRSQGLDANGSGSQIGNVYYQHGLAVITDTGSYKDVGHGTGYDLRYKATHTIYEYNYEVTAKANEFNSTSNISISKNRSGSLNIKEGSVGIHKFLPAGDSPTNGTGSFNSSYTATDTYASFATHSNFYPYVTSIGLYNDSNELLVVGKVGKPIKLSDELDTTFILRFDI